MWVIGPTYSHQLTDVLRHVHICVYTIISFKIFNKKLFLWFMYYTHCVFNIYDINFDYIWETNFSYILYVTKMSFKKMQIVGPMLHCFFIFSIFAKYYDD